MATKKPFDRDVLRTAVLTLLHAYAGDAAGIAQHLFDHRVELEPDLALRHALHQLVHHDLLGAELVAPVDQGHALADVREVERFLDRGIAAPDHHHVLALEEESRRRWRRPTPRGPISFCSEGRPRYFAVAPVAMTSASQV
jgi:hypothetical protein